MWEGKKIGAIVQARMSSTRLPGKVLLPLPYPGGAPTILHVLKRATQAQHLDTVILATSEEPEDDALAACVAAAGYPVFRGSLHNVLERYHTCAQHYGLDVVVRLTGDCPALDPAIIDRVIASHLQQQADYSTSAMPRTFPHGMDVGMVNFSALDEAQRHAQHAYEREHVMPYFYKSHPDRFRLNFVSAQGAEKRPELRITLDTPQDYGLLNLVFQHFEGQAFGLREILELAQQQAAWFQMNQEVTQKKVFSTLEEEMEELRQWAEKQDLKRALEVLNRQGRG